MSVAFSLLSEELRAVALDLGIEKETAIQREAIPAILDGENVLIIAPTGSGKTEAALLPILDLIRKSRTGKIGVIYVTPLRALNRDMLRRIELWGKKLDLKVEVRHGDTTQRERRHQALHPPDILITTPETLQVLLVGSRLRENLSDLNWVIVDEIHQLASDRRGAQLSVGLERLRRLTKKGDFQRIGISATVSNANEVANFLCGMNRTCRVIDASHIPKSSEYLVEFPQPDIDDQRKSREIFVSPQTVARMDRIADLIASHERSLIFVNSRTVAETLASRFAMLQMKVGAHHGSLPREERERAEQDFKDGKLQALVCTSTLELGIDIGSVDLVIQYMSPRRVNSLIQRVGRSGHTPARRSEGVILSVSPEDSLESIVTGIEASKKNLEPVVIQENPLDVLAHQVAGLLLESRESRIGSMLDLFKSAYPFRALTSDKLLTVLHYMQKLGYLDLQGDLIFRKRKCREYYLQNLSMIPDERRYTVIDLATQQRVGILGEEFMIIHAKVGLHFIIKGRVWKIESIQGDSVYVTPIEDPTAAVPGWDGEMLSIPERIAERVGEERRWLESSISEENLIGRTRERWNADRSARESIILEAEKQAKSSVSATDTRILVEQFYRYLIIHTHSGDRVNRTLGELFEEILLREGLVRHWWNDGYRILLELTTDEINCEEIVSKLFNFNKGTEGFLNSVIRKHFPFGYQMKFIAERFGALRRGLMLSEEALKELTVKFRFTPIFDETLREALQTQIDIPGALKLLKNCREGAHKIVTTVAKESPSPLAMYILSRYAEFEDFGGGENLNSFEAMKAAIEREIISLHCFACGNLEEFVRVGQIEEIPICPKCSSSLLAVLFFGARYTKQIFDKRKSGEKLDKQESELLSRARRSADLVLSYGKKGVIALCVYGIGPQTASKILSRMHWSDEEFYQELLQAKIKFIETKQYWD